MIHIFLLPSIKFIHSFSYLFTLIWFRIHPPPSSFSSFSSLLFCYSFSWSYSFSCCFPRFYSFSSSSTSFSCSFSLLPPLPHSPSHSQLSPLFSTSTSTTLILLLFHLRFLLLLLLRFFASSSPFPPSAPFASYSAIWSMSKVLQSERQTTQIVSLIILSATFHTTDIKIAEPFPTVILAIQVRSVRSFCVGTRRCPSLGYCTDGRWLGMYRAASVDLCGRWPLSRRPEKAVSRCQKADSSRNDTQCLDGRRQFSPLPHRSQCPVSKRFLLRKVYSFTY